MHAVNKQSFLFLFFFTQKLKCIFFQKFLFLVLFDI